MGLCLQVLIVVNLDARWLVVCLVRMVVVLTRHEVSVLNIVVIIHWPQRRPSIHHRLLHSQRINELEQYILIRIHISIRGIGRLLLVVHIHIILLWWIVCLIGVHPHLLVFIIVEYLILVQGVAHVLVVHEGCRHGHLLVGNVPLLMQVVLLAALPLWLVLHLGGSLDVLNALDGLGCDVGLQGFPELPSLTQTHASLAVIVGLLLGCMGWSHVVSIGLLLLLILWLYDGSMLLLRIEGLLVLIPIGVIGIGLVADLGCGVPVADFLRLDRRPLEGLVAASGVQVELVVIVLGDI